MSTLNRSKLPEKTLTTASTEINIPAIEFVREGLKVYADDLTAKEWCEIFGDAVKSLRPHFKYFYFLEVGKCLQLPFLPVHNLMLEPGHSIILHDEIWAENFSNMPKLMALTQLSCEGTAELPKVLERYLLLNRSGEMVELAREITRNEHVLSYANLPTLNGETITKYSFRGFSMVNLVDELVKPRTFSFGMALLGGLREQALLAIRVKRQDADSIEQKVNSLREIANRIAV